MISRLTKIFAILTIILFSSSVSAYHNPDQASGFVNDFAGLLSVEQKTVLENKLSSFEKETSNEISIAIIKSLDGDTIENFATELFLDWGIGKDKKDNGVLLLVAKDDREMRIEVGYGMEGALTDAQSYQIINRTLKPAFQKNNYFEGLNEAIDQIISATKGEYTVVGNTDLKSLNLSYDSLAWIALLALVWLSSILGRSKSWWLGGFIGAILGVGLSLIKGFLYFGLVSIAVLIPFGLLFDYIVSKQYKKGKSSGHLPWWIGGGNGRGGFGGFGGGMSGGGGSSGKW